MSKPLPKSNLKNQGDLAKSSLSARVCFSFKYLDCNHPTFCFKNRTPNWYCKLIEQLKNWTEKTSDEIRKESHSHKIEWSRTSQKSFGLHISQDIVSEPWQLSIGTNHGRMHGFFIGNTFYVRWIDHDHQLYP